MSFEDTFYCNHCCFTFIIEDIKFHINEDEKLEEYILIMLKEGLGKDSKTSGFVMVLIVEAVEKILKLT